MFGKWVPALLAGVLVLPLGACAVGSIKTVPAAELTLSPSQQSLREQAAVIAQTSWDQVRDQGSSIASFASVLMNGRSDEGAEHTPDQAEAYLNQVSARADEKTPVLELIVADVDAKADQVARFLGFARSLKDGGADAEDQRIVELASAQLKRQRATFETAGRRLAADEDGLDVAPLDGALARLESRIEELDHLISDFQVAAGLYVARQG